MLAFVGRPADESGSNTSQPETHKVQLAAQDTAPFRQARLRMNAAIQNVSLVLCNDQPQTFGAPDVLQLSAADLAVHFAQHTQFPDRPPSQVSCHAGDRIVHCEHGRIGHMPA